MGLRLPSSSHVVDEQRDEATSHVPASVGEQLRHLDLGIERPLHRLDQERGLVAEEVDHQRGVHARLGRNRPHRRALVAALGEEAARGLQDRLAGGARAGSPARAGRLGLAHLRSLSDLFNAVKSTW